MPRNPNAEPKPFVLIDIPSTPPERKPSTTHEKFAGLTGRLELTFTVVSEYLFVGSGAYEFDPNARGDCPDVWYTFYRRNGQICVPGTSIKGAIRAIVEAISNSCVSQSREHERRLIELDKAHLPAECKVPDSLCPACRLFGVTGFRGKVSFTDALPIGPIQTKRVKIPELWHHDPKRIRKLDRARRFYERKRFEEFRNLSPERGRWFVEAIPVNSAFKTTLFFENLSIEELGLLFHAWGWAVEGERVIIAFAPKIGGAKPRCFGSVQFDYQTTRLSLWSSNLKSLLARQVMTGGQVLPFLSLCLQECPKSGLLHLNSWKALAKGFQLKNETCPKGVY
jgi:CRISPR/Cas system CSM-associated protein Csm3 (group 7 of RAMP superfamily)